MTDANCCRTDLKQCLPPELFKSLSDPNRVAILARVAENAGEMSVGEVAGCCAVDLSVVSRHLRMLREAGVLAAEKRGKQVFYRAQFAELIALLRSLADALELCCPDLTVEESNMDEQNTNKKTRPQDPDSVRKLVRDGYGKIARGDSACKPDDTQTAGSTATVGCCCGSGQPTPAVVGQLIGYSDNDLAQIPDEANLGLGCGNPTALASLQPGEVVLDLGSGAGMDAFLAASKVGPTGKVIGVDMTDDMVAKARRNAKQAGFTNVEFRSGLIEQLPVADASVDVIISNCVINLSPQKEQVFREALRVLKPGGRLMVSDVVLERELPQEIVARADVVLGCVGGASLRSEYLGLIEAAGFTELEIVKAEKFGQSACLGESFAQALSRETGLSTEEIEGFLAAITSLGIVAFKPAT